LEEYNITNKKDNKKVTFSDAIEENIYNTLLVESLSSDELAEKLNIDISTILLKISIMEIN
jgi:predicted transcriptional regulator